MNSATPATPSIPATLQKSRRLATLALVIAACIWLVLLVLESRLPAHAALIGILAMAAEAGMVGGLADWYAVTVLFRNPFGKLPLPALLREHTEIIPRNKTRIAESMGRFVQENFLAPEIVRRSLRNTDASQLIAEWLSEEENVTLVTDFIQKTGPRLLQFFESKEIEQFLQENTIEWVKNTPLHRMSSEMLRAILENDFHHEALQRGLDGIGKWIKANPEKAHEVASTIFEELGVGGLARGASWIGIDVQGRAIQAFVEQVEDLLEDRNHPWRTGLEESAHQLMKDLRKKTSKVSKRLNNAKNALAESDATINFLTGAVMILREAIKRDLEQPDSGLALNMRGILLRFGQQLQENERVRVALNHEIEEMVVTFTSDYSEAIIAYIRDKIHEWDTREMIAKIESEVGGDLHMIRVNGVVVGAFIGLALGAGRWLIHTFAL